MRSSKFWLLLTGGLLAVCAVLSAVLFLGRPEHTTARIEQDGVCIRTIDLSRVDESYSFTVEWEGGFNVVQVERGRIRVLEADCPDQVCVRQGWLSSGAVPIACLPHHLSIRLVGAAGGIDGAAG